MPALTDFLTDLDNRLRSRLTSINAKLVAKGQSNASSLDDVPELIESIETGVNTTIEKDGAAASDIKTGKKAYVNGSLVTGNMSSVSVPTPTVNVESSGIITASVSQSAGYTSGGNKTSDSVTLNSSHCSYFTESNIKKGVTIFGKTGTYAGTSGYKCVIDSPLTLSTSDFSTYTATISLPNYESGDVIKYMCLTANKDTYNSSGCPAMHVLYANNSGSQATITDFYAYVYEWLDLLTRYNITNGSIQLSLNTSGSSKSAKLTINKDSIDDFTPVLNSSSGGYRITLIYGS